MEIMPLTLSIIYFVACFVYSFIGIYILHINLKSGLNRVFFILCISLCIWAFGSSIAISAPDASTSLLWRRISAVGWGSICSVLLHFLLVAAKRKRTLKKWWLCALIYLPAAITISLFSLFDIPENILIKSAAGWINIAEPGVWTWFCYAYYTVYIAASILVLWNWRKRIQDIKLKRQLLIVYSAMLITAAAIIVYIAAKMSVVLILILPLIMLVPAIAIFCLIKKHRLKKPNAANEDVTVLNEDAKLKIYNYISGGLIAGAFLNFISQYLIFHDELDYVLANSLTLVCFGAAAYFVQRLKLKQGIRNICSVVIVAIAIPAITLRFSQYAGMTVWSFPFVMLIIALIYNKRTMLIAIAASTVLTEVYLWLAFPKIPVFIDGGNYIGRIGLFCIATWVAVYVNKVYGSKIKENASQIRLQKLVSEISTDFLNVTQANLRENMNNMLQKSSAFFEADRAYAFLYNTDLNEMVKSYEWSDGKFETSYEETQDGPSYTLPIWINQILSGRTIIQQDIHLLPEESSEKDFLTEQGINSCIFIPIYYQEKVLGMLGFGSSRPKSNWNENHIDLLKIIANISAEALVKVDAEIQIKRMAYFDHLTSLPNRALFLDRITQAIYQARRANKMLGVIFLDLDDFKNVNDTMGHHGGDELLLMVAQKLSDTVRKSDTVARFGGDEFLILVNDIKNLGDIIRISDKLMTHFNKPFRLKGQEFYITASAGVTLFPIDGEDPENLIKNADIAMYKAKEKGKNQYVLCSSEMKEDVNKKMKITSLLYHALERHELVLYYQPQICLHTKKIIGLEALLRWRHPKLGMIYPKTFIPLAEQTGLINTIGEWVIKTASEQNKLWQDMGLPHIRMGVNVSIYQFRNPNFVGVVEDLLQQTGLSAEDLEFEITESMIMRESDYIIDIFNGLKKLGIAISIDDFGTEYSSLSRLKMLPIDRIKMDMQFVHGIEKSEKDKAITKVIISLAQNLGMKVVAEGVETEQQLQFLSQRMCDEVQGYYCCEPVPAEEIELILRNEQTGKAMLNIG